MNADQLEQICIAAGEVAWNKNRDDLIEPLESARAIITAMRTPITAEALLAAGWTRRSPNTDYWWSKNMVSITNDKGAGGNGRWTFHLYESRTGTTRCHPENMHDLRELVRLLGGAK